MKWFKLMWLLNALVFFVITGCEKDNLPAKGESGYRNGVFIINEGTFNQNNGSVSWFRLADTLLVNDIFQTANGRSLGDVVQSIALSDTIGIIVVNNSSKIEFVSLITFKTLAEPVVINYPRYCLIAENEKAYVSAGSQEGTIHVIDLETFQITDSIHVGNGPENMVAYDNRIFVVNSGGWGKDSSISVINTATDMVTDTFITGDCPSDIVISADHNLWIYARGYTNYADISTDASIQKIDRTTGSVLWQEKVGNAFDYLSVSARMAISHEGETLYYLRPDGVYKLNTSSPVIEDEPFIAGNFYGLEVDPDNRVFVFESSFTGNGTMKIYNTEAVLLYETNVGIGPNGAAFDY